MPWPRSLVMLPRFCSAVVAFLPCLCKGVSLCKVLHSFYALAWLFSSQALTHTDFGFYTLGLKASHIGTLAFTHTIFAAYIYDNLASYIGTSRFTHSDFDAVLAVCCKVPERKKFCL